MDLKKLENKINIISNKLRIGKFDEVIRDSKLLIKKFSDQQILYNILSLAYQQKGENDKSIDLLTNALKKNPKNIFFLNNMGASHYNKKNLVEAEYYFKRALEINPNYINALNNLGNWYQQLVAESLGKKGKGINPTLSFGPKDHHSLLQLYLDGPKDKFFTFFNSSQKEDKFKVAQDIIPNNMRFLKNKNLSFIINAQSNAVKNIFKLKKIFSKFI